MRNKQTLIITLLAMLILIIGVMSVQAATVTGWSWDLDGDGTEDLKGLTPINGSLSANDQSWTVTYEQALGLSYDANAQDYGGQTFVVKTPSNRYFKARQTDWLGPVDGWEMEIEELFAAVTLPTAGFSSSASGLSVNFTDTSSGTIDSWSWTFGDGGSSAVQNPSHTYANGGSFNVCLQVTNSAGSDQTCKSVSVQGPPTGNFSFTTTGLTVKFTDKSTDNPTAWAWDFDDGKTSTAQNPSHTYAKGGTYNVCLTVTNDSGNNKSCANVTVSKPASGSGKTSNASASKNTIPETIDIGPIRPGLDIGGAPALLIVQDDEFGRPSLVVYGINDAGVGYLAFVIKQEDLTVPADHIQGDVILEGPDKKQFFYVLDSGEIQVNIGPDWEGKVQEIVLTKDFEIVERREFNIYDVGN